MSSCSLKQSKVKRIDLKIIIQVYVKLGFKYKKEGEYKNFFRDSIN